MTSASQFSLEEENFYKDIQDLVKKGSDNEKQLSTFLQRYMDLLARADFDDEVFIINFTKAALILEASTKVYGNKVDRLWVNLEQVLEALKVNGKSQNNKKKGENDEEVDEAEGEAPTDDAEPLKKVPNPRRRKKAGDGLSSPDDFLEIDNISGLLGKNMNEDESSGDVKIKFLEEIPNLFIKNKSDRRKIDVSIVQTSDDRDDSRLKDWIISPENMLLKDLYLASYLDGTDISITVTDSDFPIVRENIFEENSVLNTDNEVTENDVPDQENVPQAEPSESAEPAEPAEPSESTEPAGSAEPAEPAGPAEPSESTEPAGSAEPSESTEPTEPTEPAESAEPVEPMESVEPVEPVEPMESAETGELVRPMESDDVPEASGSSGPNVPDFESRRRSIEQYLIEKRVSKECRDKIMEAINRSHEVDVGKFPNVFLNRIDDALIDINEVLWNSAKFEDPVPSRKMRVKKANKTPCQMCSRKTTHTKKTKRCQASATKNRPLDDYFSPLAQPGVSEPPLGILPGEELHNMYKIESKLVEKLGKVESKTNMYEAFHPESADDENDGFVGFDAVENRLMRSESSSVEDNEISEVNDGPDADDIAENAEPPEPEDVELPLPTTENSVPVTESPPVDVCSISSDPALEKSRMEYQEILSGELKNQAAAKSQFEKNKELGSKIANWHASLAKKLEESQKRGPLNVDQLAGKIMHSFPSTSSAEKPAMSFQSLVQGQTQKDISRYFFACLQLTNEGNVDIYKSNDAPLATDCVMLKQLRTTRVRNELDEYSNNTSPKKADKPQSSSDSSDTMSKRKRNSDSSSSSDSATSQRKLTKPSSSESDSMISRKRKSGPESKSSKKRKDNSDSDEYQPTSG